MTIKELKEHLDKYDENLQAVIYVREPEGDGAAYDINEVNDGWLPSGVISIEAHDHPIMS